MVYDIKNKMDTTLMHIDAYINVAEEPCLSGLRYFLIVQTDMRYENVALVGKLHIYLSWMEEEENYEACAKTLKLIKEYEHTSI